MLPTTFEWRLVASARSSQLVLARGGEYQKFCSFPLDAAAAEHKLVAREFAQKQLAKTLGKNTRQKTLGKKHSAGTHTKDGARVTRHIDKAKGGVRTSAAGQTVTPVAGREGLGLGLGPTTQGPKP